LREEFKSRFQDFRKHETSFRIFASSFEVDAEAVPEKFQMELTELQSREKIRSKCDSASLLEFYKLYIPENNFLQLQTRIFSKLLPKSQIFVSAIFIGK
jgi:hypothetical protein